MAAEAGDVKNRGAYVHRLSKGHARWFFNVSLPLGYLEVDERRLAMEPESVGREVAALLDLALKQYAQRQLGPT